jgi:hypothetical protein
MQIGKFITQFFMKLDVGWAAGDEEEANCSLMLVNRFMQEKTPHSRPIIRQV